MQENTENKFSINMRVVQLAEYLNLTRYKIHKATGISEAVLLNIFKGKNKPSADFIVKILNYYKVNANWLLTGKGEMLLSESYDQPPPEIQMLKESDHNDYGGELERLRSDNKALRAIINKQEGKIELLMELLNKQQ